MGENVPYVVRVLKAVEEEVEVYALTRDDAEEVAMRGYGVIRVLEVKEVQE